MAITLSIIQILIVVIASIGVGFIYRSAQLKKKGKRITELENEMISNHAEILKLHKEIAALKGNVASGSSSIPVVQIYQQDKPHADGDGMIKKSKS